MRNYKSFKQTMRRLEEAALSCRGEERAQLLRRWLVALKEIERTSRGAVDNRGAEPVQSSDEPNSPPKSVAMVSFSPCLKCLHIDRHLKTMD